MFNKDESNKSAIKKQNIIINKLLKKPENKFCADCKNRPPSWASINLGVFVCIECSGRHRELGTHISKIKSINLDAWSEELLENFKKIDNRIANDYWEYNLKNFDFGSIKNDRNKLMEFIRNKYEFKKWINQNEINPMKKIILESEVNKIKPNYNYTITNFNQKNKINGLNTEQSIQNSNNSNFSNNKIENFNYESKIQNFTFQPNEQNNNMNNFTFQPNEQNNNMNNFTFQTNEQNNNLNNFTFQTNLQTNNMNNFSFQPKSENINNMINFTF